MGASVGDFVRQNQARKSSFEIGRFGSPFCEVDFTPFCEQEQQSGLTLLRVLCMMCGCS